MFSSYGAHLRFETALECAMTELLQGSAMHQTLLAAYDKLFAPDRVLAAANMA